MGLPRRGVLLHDHAHRQPAGASGARRRPDSRCDRDGIVEEAAGRSVGEDATGFRGGVTMEAKGPVVQFRWEADDPG